MDMIVNPGVWYNWRVPSGPFLTGGEEVVHGKTSRNSFLIIKVSGNCPIGLNCLSC